MSADDFEVSIFLTETSTRHSLLFKQKHFHDPGKAKIKSNSSKLTGDTDDTPIEVEDGPDMPVLRREESEEDVNLGDLPPADFPEVEELFVPEDDDDNGRSRRSSKRPRATGDDGEDSSSDSEEMPEAKRKKEEEDEERGDDKKKMAMSTTYDGFAIYGRVLCLIVKRKDTKGKAVPAGRAMMEDWITSTQMPPVDDDG